MASPSKLPPVDQIPSLSTEERAAILDLLFEPSTQLHTLSVPLLHDQKFPSYAELIAAVGVQLTDLSESVSTSDTAWLQSILGSHPRLGAKKVESAQSQAEQAQLQGSDDEAEQLRVLNEEYEKAFPGLRYVVSASLGTLSSQKFANYTQLSSGFCEWQEQARYYGGHETADCEQ
jgi:2-oxo-4-hydroxy-4-carboxy--5-ureidoimidazoline (OHCU) decarboxylase